MHCEFCGRSGDCNVCGGRSESPDRFTEDRPAPRGWSIPDLRARVVYLIQCQTCRARQWVSGDYDGEVNSLDLADPDAAGWTGGNADAPADCPHEDTEILDSDPDEPPSWW